MKHHIAEEEIEERASLYALGALSQHETRAFDEHLAEGCEACGVALRGFQSVVENLTYDAPEAATPANLREKLLARIADEATLAESEPALLYDDSRPVVVRGGEGEWQEMCAGVVFKQLFVDSSRNTVTSLVKMQPGASVPMHRHLGLEECYVIEGDVSANNETLTAGDYTCAFEGSIHHPLSTINGALLLIVAPESFEVLNY
jgi:anti-sigma factor ChrR (cupin superfamily)